MKKEFVSRSQLELLPERIRKVISSRASVEFKEFMLDLYSAKKHAPLNILTVGSGGSYPAAIYAKYAINSIVDASNVEAVTPQTAKQIITRDIYLGRGCYEPRYDLVIGISHSGGKTNDIKSIANICLERNIPFLLITGAKKEELSEPYNTSELVQVISYYNPEDTTGKEKGMISMASTLSPILVLGDMKSDEKGITKLLADLSTSEDIISELDIAQIAKLIKENPVIHVFYEWATQATVADIESKFTESGIAHVILHEKKNFAHGRCVLLCNQKFGAVINLTNYNPTNKCGYEYLDFGHSNYDGYDNDYGCDSEKEYRTKYDKMLSEYLTKLCSDKASSYIELGTVEYGEITQWNIKALMTLPYLITSIGEEMDIDISKPIKPYPPEALKLYEYKDEF